VLPPQSPHLATHRFVARSGIVRRHRLDCADARRLSSPKWCEPIRVLSDFAHESRHDSRIIRISTNSRPNTRHHNHRAVDQPASASLTTQPSAVAPHFELHRHGHGHFRHAPAHSPRECHSSIGVREVSVFSCFESE
jgi:hypothetical protein